ncbi:hypothetical protein BH11BAC3_BH11BAC3_45430 [soil metagenome]
MEAAYKNLSLFFVFILVFVVWGFFKSYFGLFPTFTGLTTVQHFHGLMMLSWFAMLIIQPMLIRYKKIEWHRSLGKFSYVLIPLILLSLFLVTKMGYIRNAATMPKEAAIGNLALNLPDLFAFAIFYVLAIINIKNTSAHMRYMIATSLLLLGPGTGRAFIIYGGMPFPQGVEYSMIVTEIIAIALIAYDKIKGNSLKPYLVMLAILITMHIIWQFQMSWWWQALGGEFAKLFF